MPLQPAPVTYRSPTRTLAQTKTHKYGIFPAPSKGLATNMPLTEQDPLTGLNITNWHVRRYGNEIRSGYKRWKTNLGGLATPAPVMSLMAYNPPRGAAALFQPRLFAACADGNIYDVTSPSAEGVVPPIAVSVPGQTEPGEFSWTNFATAATNYLCICSAGGGYWTYDSVGGWVNRTASITGAGGPFASRFDFVMAWKNRLWFIVDNTADTFYLATNAISGVSSNFDFGALLVHGGDLKAMASWTVDGGDGIDDKLVLMGQGGDVLVYEGTDPAAAATFRIIGRWFAGRPPSGRRFFSKYGGDLSILCENGIQYMSQLLQARGLLDPETEKSSPAHRFNEAIGRDVRATRGQNFWRAIFLAGEECMLILTPHNTEKDGLQYIFGNLSSAWSIFRSMPMLCGEEFEGDLYFGTVDGKVCKAFAADTDDELQDGTPGRSITANFQSAFVTDPQAPMDLKRFLFIMPMFQASQPPSVLAQINSEWTFNGIPGSPPYAQDTSAKWDSAIWDQAVWGGVSNTYYSWIGAEGMGIYASLRMSVRGVPGTIFTGWKLVYESGGIM